MKPSAHALLSAVVIAPNLVPTPGVSPLGWGHLGEGHQGGNPLSPRKPCVIVHRGHAQARAGCVGLRGIPLLQAGDSQGPDRTHLHDRAPEGEWGWAGLPRAPCIKS